MSKVASPAPPAWSQAAARPCGRRPQADERGAPGAGQLLGRPVFRRAARRLATVGRNVLATHKVTALGVLGRQLRNPLLILLLAAAGVSAATGDPTDGVIIAAIVVLSVGLGFINEYRSELAVAALHANIRHQALVWRDGNQQRLDVRELVPGDVVALRVGDLVLADLRLLEANQLECDEAVLTGEPMPAVKTTAPVPAGDSTVDLPLVRVHGHRCPPGPGAASWWPPARRPRSARSPSGQRAPGRDRVPGRAAGLLQAAGAGRRGADDLDLRHQRALHRPLLDALLFSSRSPSASPHSCSRRSSASACRPGRGSWPAAGYW